MTNQVGYTGPTGDIGYTGPTGDTGPTGPSLSQNLANVLSVGNNAGTTGIDMNSQNITNANSIGCDIGSTSTSVLDTLFLTMTDISTSYSASLSSSQLTMDNTTYVTHIIIDATVPSINIKENTTVWTTIKANNINVNCISTGGEYVMPIIFTNNKAKIIF